MTIMYVWLVQCPTCKEGIRLETKTEAKAAYYKHMRKCSDVEKPRLVEAMYIGS
jgi:hypothetical protein